MISVKKNPKLFFCGLARNCENSLLVNIQSMVQLKKNWQISGIILENESTDRTRSILPKYAELLGNISIETGIVSESQTRYERMAALRNQCLESAKQSDAEWVCVVDLDLFQFYGLDSYTPQNPCESIFGLMPKKLVDKWHPGEAVGFMGLEWVYYDLLAVEFADGTRPHWIGDINYPDTKKPFVKSDICSVKSPQKVNSAFGGMAFYKKERIMELEYSGEDCEHIEFNRKAGGIFITDRIKGIYFPQ